MEMSSISPNSAVPEATRLLRSSYPRPDSFPEIGHCFLRCLIIPLSHVWWLMSGSIRQLKDQFLPASRRRLPALIA